MIVSHLSLVAGGGWGGGGGGVEGGGGRKGWRVGDGEGERVKGREG